MVTFVFPMEVVNILVEMIWIVMNLNTVTKMKRFVFQNGEKTSFVMSF